MKSFEEDIRNSSWLDLAEQARKERAARKMEEEKRQKAEEEIVRLKQRFEAREDLLLSMLSTNHSI